jgi:hypothetical protein
VRRSNGFQVERHDALRFWLVLGFEEVLVVMAWVLSEPGRPSRRP